MARTFVMGDVHGAYKALVQVLERAKFNYDEDTLIQLGDVADGWPEVNKCVEELISIRNLIAIKGNHDDWFNDWIQSGIHPNKWRQGGYGSAIGYLKDIDKEDMIVPNGNGYVCALNPDDIPPVHQHFFRNQHHYYIDDKNRLFIHGGFNRHIALSVQPHYVYWWDRDLWSSAMSFESMVRGPHNENSKFKIHDGYSEVFIGHTTVGNWGKDTPMKAANIWNLDTGAGWEGKLTLMDIDTKEYWQSDKVSDLYPGELGRRGH